MSETKKTQNITFNSTHKQQAQAIDFVENLMTVSRKMRVLFDGRIRQHGLTLARARTLLALKNQDEWQNQDNFYQKNLAAELEIETASLVRLVDALEKQGLVTRDIASDDRRAKYVKLTDEGKKIVSHIEAFAQEIFYEVVQDIDEKDIATGLNIMRQMLLTIETALYDKAEQKANPS